MQEINEVVHLAIETTGHAASIAVLRGDNVLREQSLASGMRSAATLAPALDEILAWCREQSHDLAFVSVAYGPGSFTGLRIGVTTTKTLCYAQGYPLVAIDSVAAVAATVMTEHDDVDEVLVGLNAFRNQVFAGRFRREDLLGLGEFDIEAPVQVVQYDDWLAAVNELPTKLPNEVACAGDEKMFRDVSPTRFVQRSITDAVGVGRLAARAAAQKKWSDPLSLVPRYLKLSAAEEKSPLKS